MINLPAVIISGDYTLPEAIMHILHQQFKKCIYITSVPNVLEEIESGHISENTIFIVDIHLIPMLLMLVKEPYYLIAIAKDSDQVLNNEHIRDYLYLGEYPKIEAQLHRILRNIDAIIERRSFSKEIERLYEVGNCLANEKSVSKLINAILEVSMNLLGAEAGSFYSIVDARTGQWSTYQENEQYKMIKFEISKNRRVPVSLQSMTFPVMPSTIVGSSIMLSKAISIDDVHRIPPSAPYSYDAKVEKKTGYTCKSMLTIPMIDKKNRILGAIQLINKYSDNRLCAFNKRDEHMMQFLSNYAAIALENSHIYKEMNDLLSDYEKIVQSIDLKNNKNSEELFELRDTIEMSPSALIITNTEGTILYANKQFESLTGYAPDEVIGKQPSILKSGEMSPAFYNQFWKTILSGEKWHGEFFNKRKDGTSYWEKSSVSSIKEDGGQIKYFVNTREDITELKDTNAMLSKTLHDLKKTQSVLVQNEKNAAIGQLAAGMAHEINNPLGFISSNVNSLGDYSKQLTVFIEQISALDFTHAKSATRRIEEILESGQYNFIKSDLEELLHETQGGLDRVKRLVEAMRAYSNIDSLNDLGPFNINETIENVLIIFKSTAAQSCDVEFKAGSDAQIIGNRGSFQQALMNLLLNALESIRLKGSGQIDVETKRFGNICSIIVTDDGVGIPQKNTSKIFDPFFTTKAIGDGAGLGLSQALTLIKTHFDGAITVKSAENQGATFTVTLPAGNRKRNTE